MQLTVQRVMDATIVLANIINDDRPMPQKGKYRVGRLHTKLLVEYNPIHQRREAMIKAYNFPQMVKNPKFVEGGPEPETVPTGEFTVPVDKLDEFKTAWEAIAAEVIDVDVQPIPLEQLCLPGEENGSISAQEMILLGDLVTE